MTSPDPLPRPAPPPDRPSSAPLAWPTVLGLGSLALLWPLTALLLPDGGGVPRALAILAVTTLVWVGVVGLGRVPRPVLTLTLTGLVFGIVAAAVSALVGVDGDRPAWALVPALALDTAWGAGAGVVAAAVQRARSGADR